MVGSPATSNRSLIETIVPSSGPSVTPALRRASAASAAARAASTYSFVKTFSSAARSARRERMVSRRSRADCIVGVGLRKAATSLRQRPVCGLREGITRQACVCTCRSDERGRPMLYKGSCHCGKVAFEVEGELAQRRALQLFDLLAQGRAVVGRAASRNCGCLPGATISARYTFGSQRHRAPLLPDLRHPPLRRGCQRRQRTQRLRQHPLPRRSRQAACRSSISTAGRPDPLYRYPSRRPACPRPAPPEHSARHPAASRRDR